MSNAAYAEGLVVAASGCIKAYRNTDDNIDDDDNERCSEGDEDNAAFMEELETHAFGYSRFTDNLEGNHHESVESTDWDPSQSPRKLPCISIIMMFLLYQVNVGFCVEWQGLTAS